MSTINFICIGPGRSGTSWLYRILREHPEITLPKVKETEFFNNNVQKGFKWYEALFDLGPASNIRGEISNMYYADILALHRINDHLPNVKIIFMARRPSQLFESYLRFGLRRGLSFAMDSAEIGYQPLGVFMGSGYTSRLKKLCLTPGDVMPILDAVDVAKHLSVAREIFGATNVHVVQYEHLRLKPKEVAANVFSFLEVAPLTYFKDYSEVVNASGIPRLKFLGVLASRLAFLLRKLGLYRLLTTLHNSSWTHAVVLKKGDAALSKLTFSANVSRHLQGLDNKFDVILERSTG